MSWHDPNGPWQRKLRRRAFRLTAIGGISVLSTLVMVAVLWRLSLRWSLPLHSSDFAPLFAVLAGILIASFALLIWRVRTELSLLARVPKHDGFICPRCRSKLPRELVEGSCPRCAASYTQDRLQSYWTDYALEPQRLRPWVATAPWREKLNDFARRAPTSVRIQAAGSLAVLILWLALIGLAGISSVTSVTSGLPLILAVLLPGPAGALLARYRCRIGQSRHCAQCGYQRAPQGHDPERCPECGASWKKPGGTVEGAPARNKRDLIVGCSLMAVSAALMFTYMMPLFGGRAWTMRVVPASTLIRSTVTARGFASDEWAELQRRQLTPEQTIELAEGLLERRLRKGHLGYDEGAWMWAQISAGALPAELIDRFYRETADVWVDAPENSRMGDSLTVRLASETRTTAPSPTFHLYEIVFFGGFFVGNGETPLERRDRAAFAGLLDEREYQIATVLTPSAPGPLRIRAVLYLSVYPPLTTRGPRLATWHGDGTATLPPGALWSERIELERIIDVRE